MLNNQYEKAAALLAVGGAALSLVLVIASSFYF